MPSTTLAAEPLLIGQPPITAQTLAVPDGTGLWKAYAATTAGRTVELPIEVVASIELTEGEGQIPTCSFVVDKYAKDGGGDYWANKLPIIAAEVQVTYDGVVAFWGPVTADGASSGDPVIKYVSSGCWWYMGKRLTGGASAVSHEWLKNPSFVTGFASWQHAGASIDTVEYEAPFTQSVLLSGPTATVSQRVAIGTGPVCNAIITARVKVGPSTTSGPGVAVTTPSGVELISYRTHPWTVEDATGEWQTILIAFTYTPTNLPKPQTLVLTVSGATGDDVNFQTGSIRVIGVNTANGGILSRNPRPAETMDLSTALLRLVNGSAGGLNMAVVAPVTGQSIVDEWSAHPDRFASETARLFTDRDNGIDIDVELTPTTRTVRGSYPRKGRDMDPSDLTLRFTAGTGSVAGNLASYARSRNGDAARSEMNVIDESGLWGTYRDPSAWGGVLLQDVQQAPTGTSLEDLNRRARALQKGDPGSVESLSVVMAGVEANLSWGDTVMVVVDDGAVQIDGRYRVVTKKIRAGAGTVALDMNPWVAP